MEFFDLFRNKRAADNIEKLENRALLRAIDAVANDDCPGNRQSLYRILLNVILLVPIPELPVNLTRGPSGVATNEPLKLPVLRDKDGQKFIPAFSDLEALRNWDPNAPYIGLTSIDLFKTALTSDVAHIAINLFDPIRRMIRPGGTVTRQEFQLLAEGRLPSGVVGPAVSFQLQEGEQVFVGTPTNEPPPEIVEALLSTAKTIENVDALYLAQIAAQKDHHAISQTVIGVELAEEIPLQQKKPIIGKLADSIRPLLPQNQFLDFMFVDDALGKEIKSRCKLLYRRVL